jgi:hypothetical protein
MNFYDRNGQVTKSVEYEDGQVKKTPPPATPQKPQGGGVPGGRR